ncbi:MAG: tRNA (adenosine(37)-N6)-dimethylallyltransferase MiaA [Patescibacteria group bacterium]
MLTQLLRLIDVFLGDARRPLIVLLGPTASGKTSLSIEIAKHVDGEIVNADSRQLYKYLDIGTAKITEGEMHGIPHHLLSIKDPDEEITVGKYQEWAFSAIEEVLSRTKVPILIGGSMLYIASITDGYVMERRPNAEISTASARQGTKNEQKKCSYDLLIIGISVPRDALRKRIERRVDEMMKQGWIDEVRSILARGYSPADPGMESHGYREICEYLEELEGGEVGEEIEEAKERLKQRIVTKTCQYAKRQLTWWRKDGRIHWIHTSDS